MSKQAHQPIIAMALGVILLAPSAASQTLYTMDGTISGTVLHQSSMPPAGACGQPNPLGVPAWSYTVPPPCGGAAPVLGLVPAPGIGDIAVDRTTDLVYVTDGFAVGEYLGDPACPGTPGTILNTYTLPPIPSPASPGGFMGALSGMAIDPVSGMLWVSDPYAIAGLGGYGAPPGTCPSLVVSVAAFAPTVLVPGAPSITDITWDPSTSALWITDVGSVPGAIGLVHKVFVGGISVASIVVGAGPPGGGIGICGVSSALTGIAYDLATPNASSAAALYVVDFTGAVAYIDAFGVGCSPMPCGATASLATPTFYTPSACGSSGSFPTDGLAYSAGGITYGTPRVSTTIETFGQSVLGSTTFGVEITGTAPGTNAWAVVNYSFPGPGFFCPGAPAGGTTLWVDPGAPGLTILIGPLPPGCVAIPAGLPAAPAFTGLNIFVQIVDVPFGGLPAVDASAGMEFTLTAP